MTKHEIIETLEVTRGFCEEPRRWTAATLLECSVAVKESCLNTNTKYCLNIVSTLILNMSLSGLTRNPEFKISNILVLSTAS